MGDLKKSKLDKTVKKDAKEYSLTKFELNYFKALVLNRNAAFNQYQAAIQGFVTYLAGSKWGYSNPEEFDFEVDSESEKVSVTKKEK